MCLIYTPVFLRLPTSESPFSSRCVWKISQFTLCAPWLHYNWSLGLSTVYIFPPLLNAALTKCTSVIPHSDALTPSISRFSSWLASLFCFNYSYARFVDAYGSDLWWFKHQSTALLYTISLKLNNSKYTHTHSRIERKDVSQLMFHLHFHIHFLCSALLSFRVTFIPFCFPSCIHTVFLLRSVCPSLPWHTSSTLPLPTPISLPPSSLRY